MTTETRFQTATALGRLRAECDEAGVVTFLPDGDVVELSSDEAMRLAEWLYLAAGPRLWEVTHPAWMQRYETLLMAAVVCTYWSAAVLWLTS